MKPEDLNASEMLSIWALGLVMLGLLVCAAASWFFAIAFFRAKKQFSTARNPLAMFGLIDIVVGVGFIFSMLIFVQLAASLVMPKENEVVTTTVSDNDEEAPLEESLPSKGKTSEKLTSTQVILSGVFALGELIAVFVVAVFMRARTGAELATMGWHPRFAGRDVGIGIIILLMTLPLLLALSAIVNAASGVTYNHPVIDMMKQFPWLLGVVAWQAVIVAPIAEEFFFRTVLIGWFESIHFGRSGTAAISGWNPKTRSANSNANWNASTVQNSSSESIIFAPAPASSDNVSGASRQNPYAAAAMNETDLVPMDKVIDDREMGVPAMTEFKPPWWPAVVSGVFFGLVHFSYGLSWIPLAVFGVVLGRVYQQRQSLIMCITVHMAFNAINLFNLWLSLGLPQPK